VYFFEKQAIKASSILHFLFDS